MKEVLVARADGRIVAASDKKRDGTMVTDLFPPETPKVDTVTVTTRQDGMFVVAAPIMGLNDKLGVLILVAAPRTIPWEHRPGNRLRCNDPSATAANPPTGGRRSP